MSEGYDKSKDVVLFKEGFNHTTKRWLNVEAYQYNNGTPKIRVRVSNLNSNPNCEPNKKWINVPGLKGLTKEEAISLKKSIEKALLKI